MQLINGRTAARWRAFDGTHLVVASLLALLLLLLWLAGRGPSAAAACCGVPAVAGAGAAVPAPAQPVAAPAAEATDASVPVPTAVPVPTPDPACADALPATAQFEPNGVALGAAARSALDRVARCLGDRRLQVLGHADPSGPAGANASLAEKRAGAVADYLAAHGVDRSRIDASGHATDEPVADNATAAGRARNRRAEVRAR